MHRKVCTLHKDVLKWGLLKGTWANAGGPEGILEQLPAEKDKGQPSRPHLKSSTEVQALP